jgi:two-component system chemotaxis response regulator CheY
MLAMSVDANPSPPSLTLAELLVYLVEPSGAQAKFIISRLQQLGVVSVETFTSVGSLFEQLETRDQPDLIISAMHLPDQTGTDLVERLRSSEKFSHLPFMLISSETGYRYLEPIRQAGAVGILPKPFEINDLKRALLSTLELVAPGSNLLDTLELDELKVLLVDDSPLARRFVRKVLETLGLEQFVEAGNGVEAVKQINEQMFDLVVTDYNMPEMDGRELVEYIRSHSSQPAVPVMMVTSESNEGRLAAVQQAGVSALCDKPFEPTSVRTMLERILAADQW